LTNSEPRILFIDIETAPTLAWVWDLWNTNAIAVEEDWYLLCFAYKWRHYDQVEWFRKQANKGKDRELVKAAHELLDSADIVVAHNGDKFDIKRLNARFLKYGLGPVSPFVSIDTLKEARKHFKLDSNRLNEIARYLEIGEKAPNMGFHTWRGCMNNDPEAWAIMREYNIKDIELLEEVYERLQPYMSAPHFNMQQWTGTYTCTQCGHDKVQQRGSYRTKAGVYKAYQCKRCGKYSRALLSDDGRLR